MFLSTEPGSPEGRCGVIRRLAKTSHKRLAAFGQANDGVAAIEFAMIVPIMVMLFFGSVEFSQALTVDRRITQVASSTADLVAQTDKITTTDLNDIMNIVGSIIKPYSVAPMKVSISSVKKIDNNSPLVVWSYGYNGGATYSGNYSGMPAGLIDNPVTGGTSSVIVAEVSYNFVPTIAQFLKGGVTLSEKFYLKPRKSLCVWKLDAPAPAGTSMCG